MEHRKTKQVKQQNNNRKENMDTIFQQWLMEHKPENDKVYRNAFWEVYTFWRDRILPMFTDEFYKNNSNVLPVSINHTKVLEREINKNTDVIGEHLSRSIINPVVKIMYKGVDIVFRYNYYDYEIAVISDMPIILPMRNLFRSKGKSFFYQGFPDKYKIKDYYEDNKCRFIASINDHYSFYTFMYLLQRQIYINDINKEEIV